MGYVGLDFDGDDDYKGENDCEYKWQCEEEKEEELDEYYRILDKTLDVDEMFEYIIRKDELCRYFSKELIVDYFDDLWRFNRRSRDELFAFFNQFPEEYKLA